MSIDIRAERNGDRLRLVPAGSFELGPHVGGSAVSREHPTTAGGCRSADVFVADVDRLTAKGAVLLTRYLDRLGSWGVARVSSKMAILKQRITEAIRVRARATLR